MRTRFEILFIIAALILAWFLQDAWHKLDVAERYIKNINENCIMVRKIDPIGDLQRFFNKQKNKRYACGEPDSIPGSKFRQATSNWRFDQTCYELVARMPKE